MISIMIRNLVSSTWAFSFLSSEAWRYTLISGSLRINSYSLIASGFLTIQRNQCLLLHVIKIVAIMRSEPSIHVCKYLKYFSERTRYKSKLLLSNEYRLLLQPCQNCRWTLLTADSRCFRAPERKVVRAVRRGTVHTNVTSVESASDSNGSVDVGAVDWGVQPVWVSTDD